MRIRFECVEDFSKHFRIVSMCLICEIDSSSTMLHVPLNLGYFWQKFYMFKPNSTGDYMFVESQD